MIDLIKRETIFESNPKIANEIYEFQKHFFNLDKVPYIEGIDENSIEYLEHISLKKYQYSAIQKTSKVISFEHSDLESFSKKLGEKIALLLYTIEIKKLFVFSHLKMNLFGNLNNNYQPLKEAYKQLENITSTFDYKEGFMTNLDELPTLINIAFWIERCDPSAPEYIFFTDIENRLSFFLCKDGNVHTIEYGKEILTKKVLDEQNWYRIEERCYDKFSHDGMIEGRELKF